MPEAALYPLATATRYSPAYLRPSSPLWRRLAQEHTTPTLLTGGRTYGRA